MHMAMAICSSSKHSPSLPNIQFSSYSTKSHLRVHHVHCSIVVQEDALLISAAGIHQLAGAAMQSTRRTGKFLEAERESERCSEAMIRRKRRRRRRRMTREVSENDDRDDDDEAVSMEKKARKSRFMTPKEEARYSWYLKERARIEAVKRELQAETGADDLSQSQWAKAAGISQHKLDRILWKARESEERIARCYHGLVLSIASSYQGKGLSIQDLTQEGSIGLLRGAVKFNPERGYKLSTYAYWWIRLSISRAVANKSRIIRLPGTISELMPKICEASNALSRKLRRFPTYDEIAEAIDAKPSAVRLAIERNRSVISLDRAMTSRGCMSLQDIIPGPEEMTPEAMVQKDLLKPKIRKLLQPLCDREADVLRLHYGLNGESPRSFEEIGRLFQLSRERARQINSAALSKLREATQAHHLNHFI